MTSVFAGISKIGEGYDVAEKDIPIDIQDYKLLEWLISRRKVTTQWKDVALKIQQQVKKAIETLPPEIIITLPKNRDINYFDIDSIVHQLVTKTKETTDKNFFGQYNSEKMKLWANIKSSYEKNNVHLAEAASNLVQNVKYEVPNIKKTIDQYQKQIRDLTRKEADLMRSAGDFKLQYDNACKDMNIKGENLHKELEDLIQDLPDLFSEAAELAQKPILGDAIQFYKCWTLHLAKEVQKLHEGKESNTFVPIEMDILEHVRKYGNETLTKMEKRKKNPDYNSDQDKEEESKFEITVEDSGSTGAIDWGTIGTVSSPTVASTAPPPVEGVRWDIGETPVPSVQWDLGSSNPSAINWDITIENEGEVDPVLHLLEENNSNKKKNSETILGNLATRKKFIFNLMELEAFYSQRLFEFEAQTDVYINLNQMAGSPSIIFKNDNADSTKKFLGGIRDVLSFIQGSKVQNLLEMKNSKSVLELLEQSIQVKLDHKNIAERNAMDSHSRCKDIEEEIKQTYPKLDAVKKYALELKTKIELELSKQYSGRVVHLYGEVDKL